MFGFEHILHLWQPGGLLFLNLAMTPFYPTAKVKTEMLFNTLPTYSLIPGWFRGRLVPALEQFAGQKGGPNENHKLAGVADLLAAPLAGTAEDAPAEATQPPV